MNREKVLSKARASEPKKGPAASQCSRMLGLVPTKRARVQCAQLSLLRRTAPQSFRSLPEETGVVRAPSDSNA